MLNSKSCVRVAPDRPEFKHMSSLTDKSFALLPTYVWIEKVNGKQKLVWLKFYLTFLKVRQLHIGLSISGERWSFPDR